MWNWYIYGLYYFERQSIRCCSGVNVTVLCISMEMGVCSFVLTGACSCDLTQYWTEPEADWPGLEQPHCFPCGCISSGRYLSSDITHSWLGLTKQLCTSLLKGPTQLTGFYKAVVCLCLCGYFFPDMTHTVNRVIKLYSELGPVKQYS